MPPSAGGSPPRPRADFLKIPPGSAFAARNDGMEPTDEALMRRVRKGDREAYAMIYTRHGRRVYNLFRQLGLPPAAAEDGAQDVFLGLWRGRGRYDPGRPFRPYLYQAVRNRWTSGARRTAPLPLRDPDAREAPSSGPAADAVAREAVERLRAAIAALPEDLRAPFVLRRFHHLPYEEVAAVTGLTVRQAEHRVASAFERLARALAADGPPERGTHAG